MSKPRESDYIQQLANHIRKNISKGYTIESLKWSLTNQGYGRSEIERAAKIANEQLALQAPKMVEKPLIKVETEPPAEIKKGFWQKIKDFFS